MSNILKLGWAICALIVIDVGVCLGAESDAFSIVDTAAYTSDGVERVKLSIKNNSAHDSTYLIVHVECMSKGQFPPISQYFGLSNAKEVRRPGYKGPEYGWTFGRGRTEEFNIDVPYLANVSTCRFRVMGSVDVNSVSQ